MYRLPILVSLLLVPSVFIAQLELRKKYYFENNSSTLNTNEESKLRSELTQQDSSVSILVLGYANKLGAEDKNLNLSQSRAEAVKSIITSLGFAEKNIEVRFFGEELASVTPEAEVEYRRVDVIVRSSEYDNFNPLEAPDTPSVFTIDATMDTTIVCRNGTKIFIKGRSLYNMNTGELAETVTIKVNEYISMLDFLEKGLSTRSDGQALESGGMIQIEANENNQNVAIRKGGNIKISVPCNDCQTGMSTFYGVKEKGTINWKTSYEKPGKVVSRKTLPIFAEGQESLKHFIQQNRRYPTRAFTKGVEGEVKIKFLITEKGEIFEPKLIKGVESSLDKEALRLVELMPRWTPAMLDDKPIDYTYTIAVPFKITREPFGGMNITSIGGDVSDYNVDKGTDSIRKVREEQEMIARKEAAQAIVDFGYYVITSANLGWINVDKFDRNQMTNFIVDANTIDYVKVYVIMKQQKSLFQNEYRTNSKFNFRNMGLNQEVYVLGIKMVEGKMLSTLLSANTSQKSIILDNYKETTKDEVKNQILALYGRN